MIIIIYSARNLNSHHHRIKNRNVSVSSLQFSICFFIYFYSLIKVRENSQKDPLKKKKKKKKKINDIYSTKSLIFSSKVPSKLFTQPITRPRQYTEPVRNHPARATAPIKRRILLYPRAGGDKSRRANRGPREGAA